MNILRENEGQIVEQDVLNEYVRDWTGLDSVPEVFNDEEEKDDQWLQESISNNLEKSLDSSLMQAKVESSRDSLSQ